MKNFLKNDSGNSSIVFILILMVFVILLSFTQQIIKPFIIIQTTRDAMQQAVNAVATQNAYTIYNGVREGNNTAAEYNGDSWSSATIDASVIAQLLRLLKLTPAGTAYEQVSTDNLVVFTLSNINTTYTVTPIRGSNVLLFKTSLVISVPLRMGNAQPITTVRVPMHINVKYTSLF